MIRTTAMCVYNVRAGSPFVCVECVRVFYACVCLPVQRRPVASIRGLHLSSDDDDDDDRDDDDDDAYY